MPAHQTVLAPDKHAQKEQQRPCHGDPDINRQRGRDGQRGNGARSAEDKKDTIMEISRETPAEPTGKVTKTDAEWRAELTAEQYHILREAGTERADGQVYKEFKKQGKGSYHCAGCKVLLFSSDHKFDSGCGWPSFYDPAKAENVILKKDVTMGMARTEVVCAKCGGHLGHVFEGEGYNTPTD